MTNDCQHKWKIIKVIERTHENFIKIKSPETVYHLRCEKCGDICSRRCFGNNLDGNEILNTIKKEEKEHE